MNTQPLPELIAQSQQLLDQIRQHPQFRMLRFDCDVSIGDVKQFFNSLSWEASACTEIDVSKFESITELSGGFRQIDNPLFFPKQA